MDDCFRERNGSIVGTVGVRYDHRLSRMEQHDWKFTMIGAIRWQGYRVVEIYVLLV